MNSHTQVTYPEMAVIRQALFSNKIQDIPDRIFSTISKLPEKNFPEPGSSIAVAVGSRGIDKIDRVVFHCLEFLKQKKLKPFIIPAMGSHGGATERGQKAVLAKLGITESNMDAPVYTSMEVACIDKLSCGTPIYMAKKALEADNIVVINRIKPHTKFDGDIESGLCKMLTIGLGKAEGAAAFHRSAVHHTFDIIEDAAETILKKCNVFFGLALTEDGNGKLSSIEAVNASSMINREKGLLKTVYSKMARIPFDPVDILIIDFIGKNISGIGMDSNITGRHRDITGDFFKSPHVKRIFVRDLSPDSDGNGNGIGLADVTTKRLVDALDMEKTCINALTAISPEKAAIPIHFKTDRDAMDACAQSIGTESLENARIVRIKHTANLEFLQVSKSMENEIDAHPALKRITPWEPFQFDDSENLLAILKLL